MIRTRILSPKRAVPMLSLCVCAFAVSACSSVRTETAFVGDRAYLLGLSTLDSQYATVSVVSLDDEPLGLVRNSKSRYQKLAMPKLRLECGRLGKTPTTEGLSKDELASYEEDAEIGTWTFGRNCV